MAADNEPRPAADECSWCGSTIGEQNECPAQGGDVRVCHNVTERMKKRGVK